MQAKPQPTSDQSLIEHLSREPVVSVLSPHPLIVQWGDPTAEVVGQMRERGQTCALVMREGVLSGIFTERDHLDKVAGNPDRRAAPIHELMSASPRTLSSGQSVADAIRLVVAGGYRQLPVVDDGTLLGVVAALDIVQYIADLFPAEVLNLPPDPDQVPRQEGA